MKEIEKVFILRSFKYKETDLIVHCLNSQGAKLALIAKGAQKSKKRFSGGSLDPAQYVEITYTPNKNYRTGGFVGTLSEASILESFDRLRTDYERLQLGLYFTQLIGRVSQEGVVDQEENFQLLGNALKAAEEVNNLIKLKIHFLIKLLYHQGVLEPNESLVPFLGQSLVRNNKIIIDPHDLKVLFNKIDQELNYWLERNIPGESC